MFQRHLATSRCPRIKVCARTTSHWSYVKIPLANVSRWKRVFLYDSSAVFFPRFAIAPLTSACLLKPLQEIFTFHLWTCDGYLKIVKKNMKKLRHCSISIESFYLPLIIKKQFQSFSNQSNTSECTYTRAHTHTIHIYQGLMYNVFWTFYFEFMHCCMTLNRTPTMFADWFCSCSCNWCVTQRLRLPSPLNINAKNKIRTYYSQNLQYFMNLVC